MSRTARIRTACVLLFCLVCVGGFYLFTTAWPQPLAYHDFADQRPLLGLPHMLNVVSNLPFLVVGVWGLVWMATATTLAKGERLNGAFVEPVERWPYAVFFVGLVLTAVGSAYYHADPTNDRLMWDRIGLAITLMALFTAVLAERLYDRQVYAEGRLVSGHTLKHLVAGLSAYFVLFMLQRRRPLRTTLAEDEIAQVALTRPCQLS